MGFKGRIRSGRGLSLLFSGISDWCLLGRMGRRTLATDERLNRSESWRSVTAAATGQTPSVFRCSVKLPRLGHSSLSRKEWSCCVRPTVYGRASSRSRPGWLQDSISFQRGGARSDLIKSRAGSHDICIFFFGLLQYTCAQPGLRFTLLLHPGRLQV